ncbi:MAG: DUF4349 domain-containing protein [Treponema sp.]|nr:DUF4349 domain-containing protein [Treponema sp.]
MKKNTFTVLSVLAAGSLFFVSCGNGKGVQNMTFSTQSEAKFAAPKMTAARGFNSVRSDAIATEDAAFEYDEANSFSEVSSIERKIIRNGNISLEVESLDDAESRIGEWATKFGGYITNSWESERSANYTVKIPAEKFEDAFNESKTYGKFLNGNINADDITDQYYDLETRLEAKKILRERLENYLKNAKETKELLNIEKELNSAVSEIESMEGRLRRMKDQVSYSTITINLQLPYGTTNEGYDWPSWSNGLRRFGGNILHFFIGFLNVILYVIICGIPVLAVIALLYWILFGKIGLVKKLFKKLK